MSDQPGYYAIVPASVRYDSDLPANAKLLYGEITALCNKTGECWATNAYFAELYGVSKGTVSRWVAALEKQGHINTSVERDESNVVTKRIIVPAEMRVPPRKNDGTPPRKNDQGNNTSKNNTRTPCSPPRKEALQAVIDMRKRVYDVATPPLVLHRLQTAVAKLDAEGVSRERIQAVCKRYKQDKYMPSLAEPWDFSDNFLRVEAKLKESGTPPDQKFGWDDVPDEHQDIPF
jgi:DNA-binding transcriptional regulator YhcF (GntR family)